jgi:hypothetical protein
MQNSSTLKQVLIALFIILTPLLAVAQSGNVQDVIYMKDGSILRGLIVEHGEDGSVKIQIIGYNTIVVPRDKIDRIAREPIPGTQYYKETGYFNTTSISFSPGELGNAVRVEMVNGLQVDPHFSVGLGLGYASYSDAPLDAVPAYIDLKYKILKSNSTPFAYLKAGYNFTINEESSDDNRQRLEEHIGGTTANLGIGLHFDMSQNVALNFKFGYLADNLSYVERLGVREIETDLKYRRIIIGFGLSF